MSKRDIVAGKAKQIVAEIIGDEKLQKEGERQEKKKPPSDTEKPFDNLNELT